MSEGSNIPYRTELRGATESELREAGERDGVTYAPSWEFLRALDHKGVRLDFLARAVAHHPDERVPVAVFRKYGYFPDAITSLLEKRIVRDAEREAEAGVYWNPLLDFYASTVWREGSANISRLRLNIDDGLEWLASQKDWRVLEPMTRFRETRFRQRFAQRAGCLSDAYISATRMERDYAVGMARNPALTDPQADALFRFWAEFRPKDRAEAALKTPVHGVQALLEAGRSQPDDLRDEHWNYFMSPEQPTTFLGSELSWSDHMGYRVELATRASVFDREQPAERVRILATRFEKDPGYNWTLFRHPNADYATRKQLALAMKAREQVRVLMETDEGRRDIELFEWAIRQRLDPLAVDFVRATPDEVLPEVVEVLWGAPLRLAELMQSEPRVARGLSEHQVSELLAHPNADVRLPMISSLGHRAEVPEATLKMRTR